MILDAATFEQVAARRPHPPRRRGADAARTHQDRALRVGRSRRTPTSAPRSPRSTRRCRRSGGGRRRRGRARASRSPPPRRIRSRSRRPSRSSRRSGTSASSPTAASRCGARACRACTCTSACRRPRTAGAASRRSSPWLPVVLALSANSPWYAGELTGHGVEPRTGARRAAARRRRRRRSRRTPSGRRGSSASSRSASTQDYTRIWWDVRPHPTLGTLEVRIPDQPTDVRLSVGVRGAAAGDVRDGARRRAAGRRGARSATAAAPTTRRTAGRPHASARAPSCCIPTARSVAPASELGAELLELVAAGARALGGEIALDRLDPASCEAELQLDARRRSQPRRISSTRSLGVTTVTTETIQVSGIRCERCVMRLGKGARRRRRARVGEREPDGPGAARLRRRAHHRATRCSS